MPYRPDEQTQALVDAFKRALKRVQGELNRIDLTDFQRANATAVMASISEVLTGLNEESAKWVADNVPIAARAGVAESIVALGVVNTLSEAESVAKFNRVNKALVEAVIADTQADLLAVTTNVERKVRAAVRQVTLEVLRENLASGINGRKTIRGELLSGLKKTLGDSLNTGIIDASGRRWRPEVYTETLAQTKLMRTHIDATMNEAVDRGAYYGVISRHGAKDACRNYEGKVVKLTADAPGDYPYIGNLIGSRDIFHPRCRHTVSPVRNLDRLPSDKKSLNNIPENDTVISNNTIPEAVGLKSPSNNGTVKGDQLNAKNTKAIKMLNQDPSLARKLGDNDEDMILKSLLDEQGFSGKGSVVSKNELDKFIGNGEREIFRGVSSNKFADTFREGELYAGLGTYGNGIYTAYGSGKSGGIGVAKDYAGPKGSIMRMSLKADSKVIKKDDLLLEMMDYEDEIEERLSKAVSKKEITEIESEKLLISDFGRFAALRGYDAIDVPHEKYLVILNRTALRIQDSNFKG